MASEAGNYVRFKGVGSGLHFLMEVDLPAGARSATPFENASLERGIKLIKLDEYCFSPIVEERLCPHLSFTTHSQENSLLQPTYVMNVSGLDAEHTNEIATALIDVICFCCDISSDSKHR